ncbi:MAG: ribonuclease HI family protein [Candidatus Omnitrophota bacterium]|nr:ribonuclease HI family protein [Candidatus Omnitrophota bacterium]
MKNKRLEIYVDGGARGNPGPAGVGVVILDAGGKKIKDVSKYIGEATNNIAEYNALIYGLEEALMLRADEVKINLDSELVVKQINGEYRVKDANLKPLFERALNMLKSFKNFEINHIDRSKNKEADKLVNRAINLASLI